MSPFFVLSHFGAEYKKSLKLFLTQEKIRLSTNRLRGRIAILLDLR
jgi:hypothetical protein